MSLVPIRAKTELHRKIWDVPHETQHHTVNNLLHFYFYFLKFQEYDKKF
jgi:hypothetical protein